jgi:DNA-binding phage protein
MWWRPVAVPAQSLGKLIFKGGSLYNALSNRGNPRLTTLQGILKSMGLRMAVIPKTEAA